LEIKYFLRGQNNFLMKESYFLKSDNSWQKSKKAKESEKTNNYDGFFIIDSIITKYHNKLKR
jgi:hypothetical protein